MDLRLIIMLVIGLCVSQTGFAGAEQYHFRNEQDQVRFYKLTREVRCNSCKNQSIADAVSLHAIDMRAQVYHMINMGNSDQEILDYLKYRYGETVVYNSNFDSGYRAWWLCVAPVFLLFFATLFGTCLYRCIKSLKLV